MELASRRRPAWIGIDEVCMERLLLHEFERRPLVLRQSKKIEITCRFLKGAHGDSAREVETIEVRS